VPSHYYTCLLLVFHPRDGERKFITSEMCVCVCVMSLFGQKVFSPIVRRSKPLPAAARAHCISPDILELFDIIPQQVSLNKVGRLTSTELLRYQVEGFHRKLSFCYSKLFFTTHNFLRKKIPPRPLLSVVVRGGRSFKQISCVNNESS
jgi:hypothetical protein